MAQLGHILPRLVHAIATSSEDDGPWLFMKLDIKDGFWRMVIPEEDEFNFCYVLPQEDPTLPIQIVVPSSLQMGWKESPPYFSTATETSRDVGEVLQAQPKLPPHPLEELTMTFNDQLWLYQIQHPSTWSMDELPDKLSKLKRLLEVYVDDFINAIQCTHPAALLHHSCALLHAIHSIFPSAPNPLHNPEEEPVSLKKLREGDGVWAFRKEILSWIFDGLHRTIELPPGKLQRLRESIKQVLKREHASVTTFQSLLGKLQHACLAIPNGKSMLGPLYKLLPPETTSAPKPRYIQLHKNSDAYQALADLRTMLKLVTIDPPVAPNLSLGGLILWVFVMRANMALVEFG